MFLGEVMMGVDEVEEVVDMVLDGGVPVSTFTGGGDGMRCTDLDFSALTSLDGEAGRVVGILLFRGDVGLLDERGES